MIRNILTQGDNQKTISVENGKIVLRGGDEEFIFSLDDPHFIAVLKELGYDLVPLE